MKSQNLLCVDNDVRVVRKILNLWTMWSLKIYNVGGNSILSIVFIIIGFPAHFRHLFIRFHQFSIQFRPEKLTALKSKVQFRQIVIHIRFFVNQILKFSIQIRQLSLKFVSVAKRVTNARIKFVILSNKFIICHSNSSSVIGPLHQGDDFDWNFDENECQ